MRGQPRSLSFVLALCMNRSQLQNVTFQTCVKFDKSPWATWTWALVSLQVAPDAMGVETAYTLFYQRQGIDFSDYMPNIEGRTPVNTDSMDDDFNSEYKKYCVIQWLHQLRILRDYQSTSTKRLHSIDGSCYPNVPPYFLMMQCFLFVLFFSHSRLACALSKPSCRRQAVPSLHDKRCFSVDDRIIRLCWTSRYRVIVKHWCFVNVRAAVTSCWRQRKWRQCKWSEHGTWRLQKKIVLGVWPTCFFATAARTDTLAGRVTWQVAVFCFVKTLG